MHTHLLRLPIMFAILMVTTLSHAQTIRYVNVDAIGNNNGTSWANAFTSLDAALNAANTGTGSYEIRVAAGTYKPTNTQGSSSAQDACFAIKRARIKILGGYNSTTGIRDVQTNITNLDGDLGYPGNDNYDNANRVLIIVGIPNSSTDSVIVDGVSIKNGFYSFSSLYNINGVSISDEQHGAGVFLIEAGANCVIRNCNFINNNGISGVQGGAIAVKNAKTKIVNCSFEENSANGGGALYTEGSGITKIQKCIFNNNSSFMQPGGAALLRSAVDFMDCVFFQNSAYYGGAIEMNSLQGAINITNCVFYNNDGSETGSILISAPGVLIKNSTFLINGAYDEIIGNSSYTVANCIFWDSYEGNAGTVGTNGSVSNSIVGGSFTGSNGNINTNPLFLNLSDPDGPDNVWGTADDGLRLQDCSPAVNAGDNSSVTTGVLMDIIGNPRIQMGVVDMGAYECLQSSLILAASGATATQIQNGTATYTSDCTSLIAQLKSSGDSPLIGSVTASVWVDAIQQPNTLKRHYQITPATNSSTATATVTLYFTQQDFDDFNADHTIQLPTGPNDVAGKANLIFLKYSGSSLDGSGDLGSYTGNYEIINPADNKILWDAMHNWWFVTFDISGFSGFFITSEQATLPIRLAGINAQNHDAVNELKWITAEEAEGDVFEIEHSADGRAFHKIGHVGAKGIAGSKYSFIDAQPFTGINYYRLHLVNKDGSKAYSKVVSATVVGGNNFLISARPNPFRESLQVTIEGKISGIANLTITDISGKIVHRYEVESNVITISLQEVASGIYFIHYRDNTRTEVLKVFKE